MTLFFPDLNVWVALSVSAHPHSEQAWQWTTGLPRNVKLLFSRYTQLGLLRLLTNSSVMGEQRLTVNAAWRVYDQWLEDPRVEFHPEPRGIEAGLREMTKLFADQPASKLIGDCYLAAYARHTESTLVTFDVALHELALKHSGRSVMPR